MGSELQALSSLSPAREAQAAGPTLEFRGNEGRRPADRAQTTTEKWEGRPPRFAQPANT